MSRENRYSVRNKNSVAPTPLDFFKNLCKKLDKEA